MTFLIRPGFRDDRATLEAMLFEAFHWDPVVRRPEPSVFAERPEFSKLLAGWGESEGDTAMIAESGGQAIGAAWYRLWSTEVHSYGFVDPSIPEVGMGVVADHRSKGVGRALLESLIGAAESARVPALSLSVDPANFALQLYESLGFRRIGESGTSLTLLLEL